MRADICDGGDEESVARFRKALERLGAQVSEDGWAIGVTMFRARIGGEELLVYSDAWSVDVEGPEHLVEKVLAEYRREM